MLTSSVLIVGVAAREVESMLESGIGPRLVGGARGPGCGGSLRGAWRGYRRPLRLSGRVLHLQIARARCATCRATHALLPSFVVPRRLDGAPGIYLAMTRAARGQGHRPLAERLGLPATTVRGWLRALRAQAGALAGRLWHLLATLGGPVARAPPGTSALAALGRALLRCTAPCAGALARGVTSGGRACWRSPWPGRACTPTRPDRPPPGRGGSAPWCLLRGGGGERLA